ncbi:c-type cytochrome [Piscinibacter sp.]|uniref:c-type cytochrome n=1 Tax=Piscinibacter sp. TaxID=1903157 RepID=UPI0039E65718
MTRKQGLALGAVALLAVAAAGLWWIAARPAAADVRLRPDDAALLARGEPIYATHCASCHGARLEGQPNWRSPGPDGLLPAPPHDASGHTWHHPDELLFRITKLGVARAANLPGHVSGMPAFEGVLSDAEIVAVLSWIKSRWPPSVRARHDELNRLAAQGGAGGR